jgi:hypothetical protein
MRSTSGGCYFPLNVPTGAETGIEQSAVQELLSSSLVFRQMLRLTPDRLLPAQPQPLQVIPELRFKFRPAASGIDVLNPQQKFPVE